MNRRTVLTSIGSVSVATSLAGCGERVLFQIENINCSPRLIRENICKIEVENVGPTQSARIVVQAESGDGTVLAEASTVSRIRRGEKRIVEVEGDFPDNAIWHVFAESP